MQETTVIRTITSDDVEAVIALYKEVWLDTYPNEEYGISRTVVTAAVGKFTTTSIHDSKFVAEVDGEIVGVISAKDSNPVLIQSLYVKKRGVGIGTMLMQAVFDKFGKRDYILKVAVYNKSAINFYTKLGFSILGESKVGVSNDVSSLAIAIPEVTMFKQSI